MIREPFEPESVKDWALIIHADSSGERVDVYWVDVNAGREGLRLAHEVKAWRRRDDLLTIGRRLRIAVPEISDDTQVRTDELGTATDRTGGVERTATAPPPVLPLAPTTPVEAGRMASRREYVTGRVRAILTHSETASKALARAWPEGVPGLKREGHSWDDYDRILDAVMAVEKDHSVPFYPPWEDPDIEQSKTEHRSNVWARPSIAKSTEDDRNHIQEAIMVHPRSSLLREWISYAIQGGIDHNIDTTALAHALSEFANLDATEWPDADLTQMLDGSLRALGYSRGCEELGKFNPDHAPLLMSAAFAITAGNAYLLFDDEGKPVVRTNVRKG